MSSEVGVFGVVAGQEVCGLGVLQLLFEALEEVAEAGEEGLGVAAVKGGGGADLAGGTGELVHGEPPEDASGW